MKDLYLEILGYSFMPDFLEKYLVVPSLVRLKDVGYFCGMDYASKNIYNFKEYISRFDHSLSVSLLTWRFTHDKYATLAALFHDVSTPCFSHVIDYMNKDYVNQESTEEYTFDILNKDQYLLECLKKDNISINDISDFKKYSLVDNDRPKLCADRLDGVILTSLYWTKELNINDVDRIINDLKVYKNEFQEYEFGFKSEEVARYVLELNYSIDKYCHSKEDNYMMELLACITKKAIEDGIVTYQDLFVLSEGELFNILENSNNYYIIDNLNIFKNVDMEMIPDIRLDIKKRILKPIVNGVRVKKN